MLIPKMVVRNLLAHRRKNLVISAVIACVCFFLFVFLSFTDGEVENIKNGLSSFNYPYSDIKCVSPNYLRARDQGDAVFDETVKGVSALKAELRKQPFIKEAIGLLDRCEASVYYKGTKHYNLYLIPLDEEDLTLRSKFTIPAGRDLAKGHTGEVLIHSALAKNLGIAINDEFTLVSKSNFGQVSSMKCVAVGFIKPIQDTPNLYDGILLSTQDLAVLQGYTKDEASQVLIRLKPNENLEDSLSILKKWAEDKKLPLHFFISGDDTAGDTYLMIYGMVRLLIIVVSLITMFITAFGIMNLVSSNLFDRRREIGTYYCLGVERPFLKTVYTMEIFFVNLFGAVAGILCGLVVRGLVNAMGISIDDPGLQLVAGGSHFTLGLSLSTIFWILGGICVVTLLTAATTLGKALRVSPVEAIRETE